MGGWFRAVIVSLCLNTAQAADPAAKIHFEDQIRPILRAHCLSCHGEEAELGGGLDLRQVSRMRTGGDSGSVIGASRQESLLYQRVLSGEMPPGSKAPLSEAQRELLGRWLDAGAPTRQPESTEASSSWITAEDRDFWSFQPLQRPQLPPVSQPEWTTGPIDYYVLAGLDREQLTPAAPADPRMLLRRLSYTLRGLPPTDTEVASFRQNPTTERYQQFVELWLASPQFGERWSRMWLDLVRYVDQTPDFLNSAERAWLYRDWVIRSFNDDRPYDDFVWKQLAADFDPNNPPNDIAALGFLGLSPTYWKELRLSPQVITTIVADEWDERVDAVTRTFLGLTVSCARCHNHKFDPVTIEDYYALAGVFASTRLSDRPLLPDPQATAVRQTREQVQQWQQQLTQLGAIPSALTPILQARIARLEAATPHYSEPWAHAVEDASLRVLPDGEEMTKLEYRAGESMNLPVFRRGNPSDPGDVVPRRFLQVLSREDSPPFKTGSGRADLATAILREGDALATRVYVNRIWSQIFGRGLVATTSDFGRQGDPPTHPELLEYLAQEFTVKGRSTKALIRELVSSATFRQTSLATQDMIDRDPDARWLSRFPRRRHDVEPWRDSLLTASGVLDDRMYGVAAPLSAPRFFRRTLYGAVVREELDAFLRLYDFPEASVHSPGRETTITPLQQLLVLNGEFMQQQSAEFSAALPSSSISDSRKVELAYSRLLQRSPSPLEQTAAAQFLTAAQESGSSTAEAWSAYLHVLLSLNEVLYLE